MKSIAVCLLLVGPAGLFGCAASYPARQAEYSQAVPQVTGAKSAPAKKAKVGSVSYQSKANQQWLQNRPVSKELQAEQRQKKKPKVIYQGYMKLRVRRLLEAVDKVIAIAEEAGGYVDSVTARVVVVRIPAEGFEAIMDEIARVGQLLDRHVKALDVTAQFTDLTARLEIAKQAEARLLALLKKVEEVEERLRILRELKRLSEQIENMESTLSTLQSLIDYFTVTIEFEPVNESTRTVVHRSPFPWVRSLSAHMTTIREGKDDIAIDLPEGFVFFDKDDVFRAQAADTTTLRAGRVDNEPLGDNEFWMKAVEHEMEGRDEELVDSGEAGALSYGVFRNRDVQRRYYLVGVRASGDYVYIVEIFWPNEKTYDKHRKAVLDALGTFRVRS